MKTDNRVKVGEVITSSPFSVPVNSKLCRYCGNRTLPIKYMGELPSHFVCTNCGIIQVDYTNPNLNNDDSELSNKRKDSGKIITRTMSLSEDGKGIEGTSKRKLQILEKEDLEETIIEPSKGMDVNLALERSLTSAQSKRRQKEIDDRLRIKDLFGITI